VRPDLLKPVHEALTAFKFKERGDYLREGECPSCKKRTLWVRADKPWVLRCSRLDKCRYEKHVKELFPDIFEAWSDRFKATDEDPTAAADAYLHHARGLDLMGLRGAYTQEEFSLRGVGSTATVRFALPGGGWWERLIDKPQRFGDMKARFAKGKSYAGEAWVHPADTIPDLAGAKEVWIAEGVFDAASLRQHGVAAVAAMSSGNYPEKFLAYLARAAAEAGVPRPRLIFALDSDKAGRAGIRRMVALARDAGWDVGAAQIPQPDRGKTDWNDLHLKDRLSAKDIDDALWRGAMLLAATATEKARLLFDKLDRSTFPFDFQDRVWWGSVDPAKLAEEMEKAAKEGLDRDAARDVAIGRTLKVSQIANCNPRPLYFQQDPLTDEAWYFFRIDLPHQDRPAKNTFTPAQIAKSGTFNERLLGISPMAMWTGNTVQLQRVMEQARDRMRVVEAVGFCGYSREHQAYVFNEIAVKEGRVVTLNDDDYFEIGGLSVKSVDRSVGLDITPYADNPERDPWWWLDPLWEAFGPKGYVALTFWFGALFAEQLRGAYKSYPFLELIGEPNLGKSTIIEFFWKLCGRANYEGFDPSKSTASARARNFAQVGNLPIVLMEGDRDEDSLRSSRQFDFNELKSLYNGRSVRSRGVRTSGNETYEPPFRGAIVIEQNQAVVVTGDAIPTRLVHLEFDGAGYSPDTKRAADRLEAASLDEVSGFIIEAVRREAAVLATVAEQFPMYEAALVANDRVGHRRIAKCHGQMLALSDALAKVAPIGDRRLGALHRELIVMAEERKLAIGGDHPIVEQFWDAFDWMAAKSEDAGFHDKPRLDHCRDEHLIGVNLNHFIAACSGAKVPVPDIVDLKRHLKSSKRRKFVEVKDVKSIQENKTVHCWVFQSEGAR
jgi:hypothetical protein